MKLSWGFTLPLLYCSASASSNPGHVYIWDSAAQVTNKQPPSVSPETARLILAQRLGVSKYHAIREPNEEQIRHINEFGGRSPALFGGDQSGNGAHALIWIDGVEDARHIIPESKQYSQFMISNPPPASVNERLVQDIIVQTESLPLKSDPLQKIYNSNIKILELLGRIQEPSLHDEYLSILRTDKLEKHQTSNMASAISELATLAQQEGFSLTVVVMPPTSTNSKRTVHSYGTYSLPAAFEARREWPEAVLTPPVPQPSAESQNSSMSDAESSPRLFQAEPVTGILPSCFSSLKHCQELTRNCTGHGSCALVRKGDKGQEGRSNCYSCQCTPTVVNVEDSKKTTYWGGPACQKKDVTIPFWLFAGTTVILIFLVGSGIGMLYSMGDEELPSVIGAGVSGPVRK
ncbi:hypothetical protein GQ43DRAFT_409402 [Delitschia confertaspora ATCC 74209]|uniref:DUF3844 domain-containing protein n=1 Tax=Delitschia confertaspora ATCC 74209 TaxID=1513339 RepID=A0A9P4MYP5_9PLEO|nr:hypothetical protein GQ43DRAFT_409402 [Delitschia confertaspora ATCC 74209]